MRGAEARPHSNFSVLLEPSSAILHRAVLQASRGAKKLLQQTLPRDVPHSHEASVRVWRHVPGLRETDLPLLRTAQDLGNVPKECYYFFKRFTRGRLSEMIARVVAYLCLAYYCVSFLAPPLICAVEQRLEAAVVAQLTTPTDRPCFVLAAA
jgi:hypothetical protein